MKVTFNDTTFEKLDLPDKLYKYRVWRNPNHRRIITSSKIYFAPPLDCDEQHECNLERDYSLLTDDMIYKYSYNTAPKDLYNSEEERIALAQKMISESPVNDTKHREEMHEYFRKKLNHVLSIFCASKYRDNFNLWQTFADEQAGFCVGINTRKMFENKEIFGSGGPVSYYPENALPKIRPLCFTPEEHVEDMIKVIYSLPRKYEKEEEYRLSKMHLQNKEVKINSEAIEEILVGSEMPDDHKAQLNSAVKEHLPHAKLLQAVCDIDTGYYSFSEIQ